MENEMTLVQWVGSLILSCIPCVGLILLIVWAVSSSNSTKKTWAQAMLIVQVIGIVLCIVLYAICGAALFAAFSAAGYSLIG
ncbi:MAG: hypothetical protein PUC39_02655 [Lachnospiraceae bacterium]|nr:hypothetical protein [Lachnospiraceae bacterium]